MSETFEAPTRTVRFGPAEHELYDVYGEGAGGAWVVLVHGGFWRAQYDRSLLRTTAADLASRGHRVALVEYRGIDTGSVRHPNAAPTGRDTVTDAVRAVREVLVREAPRRAVLVGHSAGGHLAVLTAHHLGPDAPVSGVVSLAGVLDLVLAAELELGEGVAVTFSGGTPEQVPDSYAASDPAALGPAPVPVVAVHGDEDTNVPLDLSRSYLERAGRPGRDRLVEVPGCGHFEVVEPGSAAWPAVLEAIGGLLEVRA